MQLFLAVGILLCNLFQVIARDPRVVKEMIAMRDGGKNYSL